MYSRWIYKTNTTQSYPSQLLILHVFSIYILIVSAVLESVIHVYCDSGFAADPSITLWFHNSRRPANVPRTYITDAFITSHSYLYTVIKQDTFLGI